MVPEDRKSQGLFLGMGVGPNLSLAALSLGALSRLGLIQPRAEDALVGRYCAAFADQDALDRSSLSACSAAETSKRLFWRNGSRRIRRF